MSTSERKSGCFILPLLAVGVFVTSISGGMDAWQYWWIRSGCSSYALKTMKVSSVKTSDGYPNSKWVTLRGAIDGVSVRSVIRLISSTRENAYLKSLQPGESVDFYCRGPFRENQEVNLIEASFITAPPNRIWWVPVTSSAAAILFGFIFFSKRRPPFKPRISPKRHR